MATNDPDADIAPASNAFPNNAWTNVAQNIVSTSCTTRAFQYARFHAKVVTRLWQLVGRPGYQAWKQFLHCHINIVDHLLWHLGA